MHHIHGDYTYIVIIRKDSLVLGMINVDIYLIGVIRRFKSLCHNYMEVRLKGHLQFNNKEREALIFAFTKL